MLNSGHVDYQVPSAIDRHEEDENGAVEVFQAGYTTDLFRRLPPWPLEVRFMARLRGLCGGEFGEWRICSVMKLHQGRPVSRLFSDARPRASASFEFIQVICCRSRCDDQAFFSSFYTHAKMSRSTCWNRGSKPSAWYVFRISSRRFLSCLSVPAAKVMFFSLINIRISMGASVINVMRK